jgi:hypothetical protein
VIQVKGADGPIGAVGGSTGFTVTGGARTSQGAAPASSAMTLRLRPRLE